MRVATLHRIGWQLCTGLGGNFAPDWVAEFTGIRTDRAALLDKGASNRLTHPPVRVGDEFESPTGLKLFQRPNEPDIALLNKVE
jgi:hypothetical protein